MSARGHSLHILKLSHVDSRFLWLGSALQGGIVENVSENHVVVDLMNPVDKSIMLLKK